jgi:3'(2'), 5'-bisphosphate nucleotidase
MSNYQKELKAAISAARAAGQEILGIYNKGDFTVAYKSENAPVTQADLAANKVILASLKRFNYGFLSEEEVDNKMRLKEKKIWLIDPLDGTKDFINKDGEFTVMIGLVENGQPVVGVVYQPLGDKMYYASAEQGAYLETNGREAVRLKVSAKNNFKSARMITSRFHLLETDLALAKKLGLKKLRPCGSAGLKVGLIAENQAEIYVNTSDKTSEWDICAADIILKEASGKLTDMRGKNFIYNKENPRNPLGYVAANKFFHKKIVEALNS